MTTSSRHQLSGFRLIPMSFVAHNGLLLVLREALSPLGRLFEMMTDKNEKPFNRFVLGYATLIVNG